MYDIFKDLNEAQRKAVCTTEGNVRVIAGAGTGKTRALTHRYAYIVRELGISASNVLCLTFTNKAANEMKRRVKTMLGDEYDTSLISTIHGFCVRILREDISKMNYPEGFVVLDESDQKKILEEIYDEMDLRLDTATFRKILDAMEVYKGDLRYLDYLEPDFDMRTLKPETKTEAVILRYIEKQRKYFGVDFADLINFVMGIFNKHSDVERKWQQRMHYIQVDEFQDVDRQEYELIKRLSYGHGNLFVVGDPDQNIYEWRGSEMGILINFDRDMAPCKTIMMNCNYRSTPQILDIANSVVSNNEVRVKKDLFTENKAGAKPKWYHAASEHDEIKCITGEIKELHAKGHSYNDIAILYRSNYVSRFIEQGLLNADIPYVVWGGIGFYSRAEIKNVLAYLRLIAVGDDLSFLRIVNTPRRKIGKIKIEFIKNCAERENTSLYEAMKAHIENPVFRGSAAKQFVDSIEKLRLEVDNIAVSELMQRVLTETKYEYYIRESGDMDRLDNISELIRSVVVAENEFGEHLPLSLYLQNVTLANVRENDEGGDRVRIMTVHTAKGLEFEHVFLAGLSDGVFPSSRSLESRQRAAVEEERRLFFVAVTRAKRMLWLSESEGKGIRGVDKLPSRFLFECGEDKVEMHGLLPKSLKPAFANEPKAEKVSGMTLYVEGDRVWHRVFGEGIVNRVDRDSCTYQIKFELGVKPISFDFTGLKPRFK